MNNDASLGDTVQFGSQCGKSDRRQDGGNDDQDGGLPTTNAGDGFSTAPENNLSNTVNGNVSLFQPVRVISKLKIPSAVHSMSESEENQLEYSSSELHEEDSKDNQLENNPDRLCGGEYFSPSLLAEKLEEESTLFGNDSSEEEDNGKENIDPHPGGDPVKAFVDDEAGEEDDSDNELMIDQGNTGKRDELHQKWLQQRDAAETENILRRFKCGVKQKTEESFLNDEEEYELCDVGPLEEEMQDVLPTSGTRIKKRELKQMISNMFADCEDPFLSDEEENETRLARQFYHNKSKEAASFLSPVEDDSSREVFGLIKKLNIAPENKTRAKTSCKPQSSFLGQAHSTSLLPARKPGVSSVWSFIFGREDSNSRSGISTSEDSDDLNRREKQPARNGSAKHSTTQESKHETRTATSPSLFENLRTSSIQQIHKENNEGPDIEPDGSS
ncbi:uncharacterized protein [Aristolochia californica]|uniref:uncharacterized protein n=1 Tax=Aristolochia californica TaxID=171875 RepID=UPI0035E2904C